MSQYKPGVSVWHSNIDADSKMGWHKTEWPYISNTETKGLAPNKSAGTVTVKAEDAGLGEITKGTIFWGSSLVSTKLGQES